MRDRRLVGDLDHLVRGSPEGRIDRSAGFG
jgi:hypothetical protein